ncbi:MAG: lysine--tRNA ligase [Candidatus Pacearchaeota archaeon]
MAREEEIVKARIEKIEKMKKEGILPYNYRYDTTHNLLQIREKFSSLNNNEETKEKVSVSGRVMSIRNLGKISFLKLQDYSSTLQAVIQDGKTPEEKIRFFEKYLDSGDIVGIKGIVFKTKTGELSVLVEDIVLLTKSIFPIPQEFYGLKDKEERYRKRYLDLLINEKSRKIFQIRAKVMEAIREFMKIKGFTEVETPLLQPIYGGAAAKPFKTHCDAFDSDVFLSIAPELYLKKAMVGGMGSVYEITKKFRNEGVDKNHNPEHMTIEWYQENADYTDGMKLFKEFMIFVTEKVFGKTTIEYKGHKIDLTKWQTLTLEEAIKKYLNIDISKIKTEEEAREIARKHGIDETKVTKGNIADELMKLFREKLIQPTFLIDYPIELAPLAKPCKKDPTKAEIFQPFIGGLEVGRAYSELSDPFIQEESFNEQEREREKGNEEAMPTDRDFVTALKYGLPPACGVGIGIERLMMLLTDSETIRDVIMFPFMKPEIENKKESKN